MRFKQIAVFLSLCILSFYLHGQRTGSNRSPGPSRSNQGAVLEVDSFVIRYITPVDLYTLNVEPADSFPADFHYYDPTKKQNINLIHLGNPGSAHRYQLFQPSYSKGLDFGMHQYDLYKANFEDSKFYDTDIPFTELHYTQGSTQTDGITKARLGRKFMKGIKLSLNYLRINHLGEYTHQRAKHTSLSTGIWYDSPSQVYDAIFQYRSNSIVQEDNGGISDYEIFDDTLFQIRSIIPVHLTTAFTTNRQRAFSMQHHIHLLNKTDTIQRKARIDVIGETEYKSEFYKFFDDGITTSLDYYSGFVVDSRGMRLFIDSRTLSNELGVQFRYLSNDDQTERQRISFGLEHNYISLNYEPEKRNTSEFFLKGHVQSNFSNLLKLEGKAYLGLLDVSGIYYLDGKLSINFEKFGEAKFGINLYARKPTLIEDMLYITQEEVWSNQFSNPSIQHLWGQYTLPDWKLHIGAHLYRIDNHIYYDQSKFPRQLGSSANIVQFFFRKDFRVGKFHLANSVALQSSDEKDKLALPEWILNHQFSFLSRVFKRNLLLRTGFDLRMSSGYRGISYFPLTGQFYLNDTRSIDAYPAIDYFISFQVKTFRAFIQMENIGSYFLDDIYLQVVDYPQFERYLRFGLSFVFYD